MSSATSNNNRKSFRIRSSFRIRIFSKPTRRTLWNQPQGIKVLFWVNQRLSWTRHQAPLRRKSKWKPSGWAQAPDSSLESSLKLLTIISRKLFPIKNCLLPQSWMKTNTWRSQRKKSNRVLNHKVTLRKSLLKGLKTNCLKIQLSILARMVGTALDLACQSPALKSEL